MAVSTSSSTFFVFAFFKDEDEDEEAAATEEDEFNGKFIIWCNLFAFFSPNPGHSKSCCSEAVQICLKEPKLSNSV